MPFTPKSPLSKGPLCHVVRIFVQNLVILAIIHHFHHFCQNCHFLKGPFAISFEYLFTVWRFWHLITFSAKNFSPNTPFSQKSPLSKGPLCHLISIFVYSLAILAFNRHFRQICHFWQNCHFPKGPFTISFEFLFTVWWFWQLIAISAIFANVCISGHISCYHHFGGHREI